MYIVRVSIPRVNPFWSTYRGMRYPTSPLPSFQIFRETYGHTYELFLGRTGWGLATEDAGLIKHVLQTNHRNYGKSWVVTETLASYIGKGLLTSDGDYWRSQRRLIQPGFSRERLGGLVNTIDKEVRQWTRALARETHHDIYESTMPLALQIMTNVLFGGTATMDEVQTVAEAVELGQEDFAKEIRQPLLKPWRRLINARAATDAKAAEAVQILLRQIDEHRKGSGNPNDLLQMLLDARYDDGSAMSDRQLIDESLVLILAGHETTAISLACTLHLLAEHPVWAQRAREEWQQMLDTSALSPQGLRNLPVLTAIINEGLRLYPPAYLISRTAHSEDRWGEVSIAAGQTVLLYIYGAHRNPLNFTHPETFDPNRYLSRETSTNFAFGGGPRLCVGYHLAMMEMQIAIGRFLQHFEISPQKNRGLTFTGSVTLRPKDGVHLVLRKR